MHEKRSLKIRMILPTACIITVLIVLSSYSVTETSKTLHGWWPQDYTVHRDDAAGLLVLKTPFYTFQHDLKRGGVITKISYTHRKAENIILKPIETVVQLEDKSVTRPGLSSHIHRPQ